MKPKQEKTPEELHDEIVEETIRESSGSSGKIKDEEIRNHMGKIFLYFIAGFIVLMFILWVLPSSFIKVDPEPKAVPKLADIIPDSLAMPNQANLSIPQGQIILKYVTPNEPVVKDAATRIATYGCEANMESYKVCQAKAIYYFVRDNFAYVSETDDYYQTPREMFYSKGGDCDDFAIMLASMEEAIGIPSRFVEVPGHVYVQIYIEDALNKYKQEDGWINVDATCRNCEFGSISTEFKDLPKNIIW